MKQKKPAPRAGYKMERAMRFELTTVTLARWGSTTELRSLCGRSLLFSLPLTFQGLIPAKLAS